MEGRRVPSLRQEVEAPRGELGRPVLLVRFDGGEFFFDGGVHALPSCPLEVFALRHRFRKWDSPHSNLSGHRGAHRSEGIRMDVPGGWLSQVQFIGYVGALHSSSIPVPESPAINAKEWIWLILLSNMYASSFLFQKLAVGSVPPFTIAAVRTFLSAGLLWGFLAFAGRRGKGRFSSPGLRPLILLGLLGGAIPFTISAWAQIHIGPGLAGILNAPMPLFTLLLAHFLTSDERLNPNGTAGVALGLAGVALVIGPAALAGLGGHVQAELAMVFASLSISLLAIYGRRLRGHSPLVMAAGQFTWGFVLLLPFSLSVDAPWTLSPGWDVIAWLLLLTFYSTALPALIFFRLLSTERATNVMTVAYLVPLNAVLLGAVFFGERLAWTEAAGLALIFFGVAIMNRKAPDFPRAGK